MGEKNSSIHFVFNSTDGVEGEDPKIYYIRKEKERVRKSCKQRLRTRAFFFNLQKQNRVRGKSEAEEDEEENRFRSTERERQKEKMVSKSFFAVCDVPLDWNRVSSKQRTGRVQRIELWADS